MDKEPDDVMSSDSSTSAIQFTGLASNLDTKSIISAMLQPETTALTNLQAKGTTLSTEKTAYAGLGSALSDLLAKVQAFTLTSAGSARSASTGDPTKFTAVASTSAVPAAYTIDVNRVATATTATSTSAVGSPITDTSKVISALPLPGTMTAGTVSLVLDGQIVGVSIGDPSATSLQSALDAIASKIQSVTGGTVTGSVVNNQVQFSVSGAGADHDIRFGAAGDSSNALALLGLSGQHVAGFGNTSTSVTGTSLLGVVRTSSNLDTSGLSGLVSTTTGTLTVNGVDIAYDTTVDSLSTVLARINSSDAGVIASIDRTNDKVVFTSRTAGASAINIHDTSGTLGAALELAPDTTNAQVVGQNAQVTVNGTRIITSDSNTVTNAIDGVTLSLVGQTTSSVSLTVGVDTNAIGTALSDMVSSYNTLADTLDTLTTHAQGAASAPLENDTTVVNLALTLRSMIMRLSSTVTTGTIQSLGDLGVNSGPIGSKAGTTSRLSLDSRKLAAALAANPGGVAQLLGSNGGLLQPIVDQLKGMTWTGGLIDSRETGIDAELRQNSRDQAAQQQRIDTKQAALNAKFASLEALLATLNQQQSSVTSQVAQFNRTTG